MPAFQLGMAAIKLNQPLSFDTSKVTTMYAMFYARSARARPAPGAALSRGPSPCMPLLRRRHPQRPHPYTSSHIACPPFDSAVGVPLAQIAL